MVVVLVDVVNRKLIDISDENQKMVRARDLCEDVRNRHFLNDIYIYIYVWRRINQMYKSFILVV